MDSLDHSTGYPNGIRLSSSNHAVPIFSSASTQTSTLSPSIHTAAMHVANSVLPRGAKGGTRENTLPQVAFQSQSSQPVRLSALIPYTKPMTAVEFIQSEVSRILLNLLNEAHKVPVNIFGHNKAKKANNNDFLTRNYIPSGVLVAFLDLHSTMALCRVNHKWRATISGPNDQVHSFAMSAFLRHHNPIEYKQLNALIKKFDAKNLPFISIHNFSLGSDHRNISLKQAAALMPRLQTLHVEYRILGEWSDLRHFSHLKHLKLNCVCNFSKINLYHLESLKLANVYNDDMQYLKAFTALRDLSLGGMLLSHIGLQSLKMLTSLQKLSFDGCFAITDIGLQSLETLTSLQSLSFYDSYKITNVGLQSLKMLTSLQSLSIRKCDKITDDGIQSLDQLVNLRELDLSHCSEIGKKGLPTLKNFTALRKLNLSFCNAVSDRVLLNLSQITNLQDLNIAFNHYVTNSGLQSLSGLTNLEHLNISPSHCITSLHGLKRCLSLRSLTLHKINRIDTSILSHILALKIIVQEK